MRLPDRPHARAACGVRAIRKDGEDMQNYNTETGGRA